MKKGESRDDILEHIDVHVRSGARGDFTISAATVAESQRSLDQGCPPSSHGRSTELYATLIEPAALDSLVRAWRELERSARRGAASLLIRHRPQIEIACDQNSEQVAQARWDDDGGRQAL